MLLQLFYYYNTKYKIITIILGCRAGCTVHNSACRILQFCLNYMYLQLHFEFTDKSGGLVVPVDCIQFGGG